MNVEMKDELPDSDRIFLAETESLLALYEAMHRLQARTPSVPLGEGLVWAREIATTKLTAAISATRATLGAKSFHVRLVSVPGEPYVCEDKFWVDMHGLTQILERLIGHRPTIASTRRRRRRIPHSRKRRR